MELKMRSYSILIVSASASFCQTATSLLSESRYAPIRFASDISAAKRAVSERSFDFVVINAPLPDDAGIRFAMDVGGVASTAVLLLLPSDLYSETADRLIDRGIFLLSKPISKQSFLTALGWLASAREKLRSLEKKSLSFDEKMEEIRTVNRAKWILISEQGMTETEAHRLIEKQAMNRCVTRLVVAQEIIEAQKK